MFEIDLEEIERISDEYDVPLDIVTKYAKVLVYCELIKDDETYLRTLEETISMCSNFAERKGALKRALIVMNLVDTDEEIKEAVINMIEAYKKEEKWRVGKNI